MSLLSRAGFLLRNIVHRGQTEADLNEELLGYQRLLIEEHIRAGLSPADAQRKALIDIGGVEHVKENVRAARNSAWLEGVWQDLRYGARSLRRVPAFTATAVVALALGIGASTAIFSVVNGVLLTPLPYRAPEQLVTVMHNGTDPVASLNYFDWRAQFKTFSSLSAAQAWSPNIAGAGDAERVAALRLTANMWTTLGVAPIVGRVFGENTETAGRDREVVLSYDMWKGRYAADSAVAGRTVLLDGDTYTIVGVMPNGFKFAPFWSRNAQLWAPLALHDRAGSRDDNSLRVFGRRKDNTTLAQARADVARVTSRLETEFPRTNSNVEVTPLLEQATGGMQRPLVVLLVAVSFLLVAACANVAHMLLARSSSRQREMAVRIAIGASGARLARQLLCESLLLSSAGGLLGLLIASSGTKVLIALAGSTIPRAENIQLSFVVLLVTMFVSVATGLLFGLAPARNAMRTELVSSLKDGGRVESAGSANAGFRHVLVASQFAIALTLLIGAGLMMRTLAAMHDVNPGFDPHGVMTAEVSVKGTPSSVAGNRLQFYQQLMEKMSQAPGVQAVGAINHLPLAGDVWGLGVNIEGAQAVDRAERRSAVYRVVMPGYFRAMRISFAEGHDVSANDRWSSEPVVVINEQFAKRYWPGGSAIGKRFALSGSESRAPRWMTVVGVSRNTVRSHWIEQPEPEMYLPYLQEPSYLENQAGRYAYLTLVVRTSGNPAALASLIRSAAASLDRGVSVSSVKTMDAVVESTSADRRFYLVLLSAFAMVALVLAAVGIYGVMSHAVSRRMHEMGVRIALGASRRDVMELIVGRGMLVVAAGAAVGVGCAVGLTRLMNTITYGVRPTDPLTFGGVTVFLLLVAVIACWIPARRATRVDPLTALRGD
ncbi:MAG: ABC transporter permease [Gemmatimonas sp.]